jgi:hypothetical protein
VGDCNPPLSAMNRSWKEKLNRDKVQLAEVINQIDLIDTYKTFHPKKKRIYLLLSTSWCLILGKEHGIPMILLMNHMKLKRKENQIVDASVLFRRRKDVIKRSRGWTGLGRKGEWRKEGRNHV